MTGKLIHSAFEVDLIVLPLASLMPLKQVTDDIKSSRKYKTIARSMDEVGIIEPLVVYQKPDKDGRRLLLDGHLKRAILLEKGEEDAECLLATDDEAFTYNKRVSRLAIVQEHFMILRAVDRGVSEEKLARALDVDIAYIKRRSTMLRGICPQSVNLLRNKSVNPVTFDVLRKMKSRRQIESCQLMVTTSNYSSSYAKALLAATSDAERLRPAGSRQSVVTTPADLALMERELRDVQKSVGDVEVSYGSDMIDLVIAARYVSRLLGSARIARYLEDNHPEILNEFQLIVTATLSHDAKEDDRPRELRRRTKNLGRGAKTHRAGPDAATRRV